MWKEETRKRKKSKESRKGRKWGGAKEVSTQKVLEVEKSIWKERVGKNASTKGLKLCYRVKGEIYTKKGECKKAKLQARIKPTALCSAIDKKNSIEFLLDSLHYLYNYYIVCALLSYAYYVTSCDVTLWLSVIWLWLCDTCDITLSRTFFCIVSPR